MRKTITFTMIALILGSVISLSAMADRAPRTLTIRRKPVAFFADPRLGILMSHNCVQDDGTLDCEAWRALPNASYRRISDRLEGGMDPGAVVCKDVGGEVVIGRTERRGEIALCVFKDNSMISSGSLHSVAPQNDEKPGK